jgi:hypothetical protein
MGSRTLALALVVALGFGFGFNSPALAERPAAVQQTAAKPNMFRRASAAVQRKAALCVGKVKQGFCWMGNRLAPVKTKLAQGTRWTGRKLKKLAPVGLAGGLVLGTAGTAKAAGFGTTIAAMTGGQIALVAGGAAAVVGAGVGGYLYYRGRRNDRAWGASDSRGLMQQVDGTSDPGQLNALLASSRSSYQAALDQQSKAEVAGSRKVKKAATQKVAFSGLAATYAELLLNGASSQAGQRAGGRTPSAWRDQLGSVEQEAISRGFDGKVALVLESLKTEVSQQQGSGEKHARAIKAFEGQTKLFAKGMKADLAKVKAAADRFGQETQAETQLIESKTSAMRGRVSDRVAQGNNEFSNRRKRLSTLDGLYKSKLQPVVDLASGISNALSEIESARSSQTSYLALAASQTHVYAGTDAKGRPKYEDKSGFYRMLAMNEASRAHSAASTAEAKMSELNRRLGELRNDPQMRAEGLTAPQGSSASVSAGPDAFSVYFLPPMFGLMSNLFSNYSSAQSSFLPVKGAIDHVAGAVNSRRQQERGWINSQIDQKLHSEMALARNQMGH